MSSRELRLIETMRADGDVIPLLNRHLTRLRTSCAHLGFRLDVDSIRFMIRRLCETLAPDRSFKIRLTIDRTGRPEIKVTHISTEAWSESPVAVISSSRIDPTDTLLYHKTTRRALYDSEWCAAQERGVYEVLYLNKSGEVTEGSRSNIFLDLNGELVTPPVKCGLLPGVYRSHLLETEPSCVERILSLQDLADAEAIYVCNAVTGLVQVQLIDSQTSITEHDVTR